MIPGLPPRRRRRRDDRHDLRAAASPACPAHRVESGPHRPAASMPEMFDQMMDSMARDPAGGFVDVMRARKGPRSGTWPSRRPRSARSAEGSARPTCARRRPGASVSPTIRGAAGLPPRAGRAPPEADGPPRARTAHRRHAPEGPDRRRPVLPRAASSSSRRPSSTSPTRRRSSASWPTSWPTSTSAI